MGKRTLWLCVLVLGGEIFSPAKAVTLPRKTLEETPEIRPVTDLHRNEHNRALLVLDGYVLIGKSQSEGPTKRLDKERGPRLSEAKLPESFYERLEIYPVGSTQRAQVVEIGHSVTSIYALDRETALVIGTSEYPLRTHYTKVWREAGYFKTATTTFADETARADGDAHDQEEEEADAHIVNEELLVNNFTGNPNQKFFSEIGSQSVFAVFGLTDPKILPGSRVKVLADCLKAPTNLALSAEWLLVTELHDLSNKADDGLVRLNWITGAFEPTRGGQRRHWLRDESQSLPDGIVAVPEYLGSKVLFVDVPYNRVEQEVDVHSARGLTVWGHCLVAVSERTKRLSFIDFRQKNRPVVASWDLGGAGNTLSRPSSVAMTPSGTAYVRSNYGCPTCFPSMNSVIEAKPKTAATFTACMSP